MSVRRASGFRTVCFLSTWKGKFCKNVYYNPISTIRIQLQISISQKLKTEPLLDEFVVRLSGPLSLDYVEVSS